MPQTGPAAMSHHADVANQWINEVAEAIGADEQRAYHALRAGLVTLRNRMTVEEAAQLGAQLPLLVRGLYYEQWRPAETPTEQRSRKDHLASVSGCLSDAPDTDPEAAARAVFGVLKRHVDEGQLRHVRIMLPDEVAEIMDAA